MTMIKGRINCKTGKAVETAMAVQEEADWLAAHTSGAQQRVAKELADAQAASDKAATVAAAIATIRDKATADPAFAALLVVLGIPTK